MKVSMDYLKPIIFGTICILLIGCNHEQSGSQWAGFEEFEEPKWVGFEGFEEPNLTWHSWGYQIPNGEYLPDTSWVRETDYAHGGTFSIESGQITDNQASVLAITLDLAQDGEISFYTKVSSEKDNDFLIFYIDGSEQGRWSGDIQFPVTIPVTQGIKSFKWVYKKSNSASAGEDTAWIDDISFPPIIGEPHDWWLTFDQYFAKIEEEYALTPSPYIHLIEHPSCQDDFLSNWVIQRHGQGILDGMALSVTDNDAANQRYADAARELSRFANHLNCLDYDGVRFWDQTIGSFLEDILDQSVDTPGLSANEAIYALWNPALLVVDLIQISGESHNIQVIKCQAESFTEIMQGYPVDSYGAALLDNIGTGQLSRVKGKAALNNLIDTLANPIRLGFGVCPLIQHAQKATPELPCLVYLDTPQACDMEDLLGELLEAGIASQVLDHTPINTNAPNEGWYTFIDIRSPKSYFGTPTSNLLDVLDIRDKVCQSLKPRGLSAFIPNQGPSYGDKCVFSLVHQGWVHPGESILSCYQKFEYDPTQIPTIEYRLPMPQCGATDPEDSTSRITPKGSEYDNEFWLNLINAARKKNGDSPLSQQEVDALIEEFNNTWTVDKTFWNEYMYANGKDPYNPKYGDRLILGFFNAAQKLIGINPYQRPDVQQHDTEHEIAHALMHMAKVPWEDQRGTDTDTIHHSVMEERIGTFNVDYQPNPESKSCGQTEAQRRAEMIFDCIFGGPHLALGDPLDPWSNPGPDSSTPGIPPDCNEINSKQFFSSTGGGVTDPVAPEDTLRGGPTIVDPFRPRIEWWFSPSEPADDFVPEIFIPKGSTPND